MTAAAGIGRRSALKALAVGGLLAAAGCSSREEQVSLPAPPSPPPSPSAPSAAPAQPGAQFVLHGSRLRSEVAITFHGGGDRAITEAAMGVLERAGAPCTVFAIGTWLLGEPTLARRLLDGGHELGNHTHTHPTTASVTRLQLRDELLRCRDVLVDQTGSPGVGVRPVESDVAIDKVALAAADAGYGLVSGYDIDPRDYDDPGPALVAGRVLAQVRGGSVVFMHLGHQGTVLALPAILEGLATKGLTPVTTSTLLRA